MKGKDSGGQLVDLLKRNPSRRVAALIRHAARSDPTGDDYYHLPLLPEGLEASLEFGKALPEGRLIKIYHSPVPRCGDTAKHIFEGASSAGRSVQFMGVREFLSPGFMLKPREIVREIEKVGFEVFARRWLNGEVDERVMDDPWKVTSQLIAEVKSLLQEEDNSFALHVYVSHDWNILAVRDLYLKVRHEEEGWPDYLDGLIFSLNGDFTVRWKTRSLKLTNVGFSSG
ncbi:MAG: histidine phosphatase family protein [Candidatus Bathyarchaeia archaeon]